MSELTTRYNPPSGWPQAGRAFDHGVAQPEGKILHITGQVAWDQDARPSSFRNFWSSWSRSR